MQESFNWSCRMTAPDSTPREPKPCDAGSSDRAEYAEHMKAHGLKPPTAPAKLTTWKPPPRKREHSPKPLDPGQPIEWTHDIPGYWTGAKWGEGEWVPGYEVTRAGRVWSIGTTASTRWAVPDDDPADVVEVKLPGKRDWGRSKPFQVAREQNWAHNAIHRAENVRQRGGLYAVVEGTYESRSFSTWRVETVAELSWHADPDCPQAAGKERDGSAQTWREVLPALLGESHSSGKWCERCVWLREPEPARTPVAA